MRRTSRLLLAILLFAVLVIWQLDGLQGILNGFPDLESLASTLHPVEAAISSAEQHYVGLLTKQSTTLAAATAEYTRRYGREPPPNFDKWFSLARQHDFVFIDEFDTIMASIAPFRSIPASDLRTLVQLALTERPDQLLRYEIHNGIFSAAMAEGTSWFADNMQSFLPVDWLSLVPDMTLAMNVFDEPQVVIPKPMLDHMMDPEGGLLETLLDLQTPFEDLGRKDPWPSVRRGCSWNPDEVICYGPQVGGIQLVTNITAAQDVCAQCAVRNQEGLLMSPERLSLTHLPIPILSQAKPSVFNDILFPSPHYFGIASHEHPDETPWEAKQGRLYWTGSTTGGYANEGNWQGLHRQRLALKYQRGASNPIQLLHQDETQAWVSRDATTSEIEPLIDLRITGITNQCEPATCEKQRDVFGIGSDEIKDPEDLVHTYKFLLDVDGNSFSGRFARLLRTNSVVLKKSIFQEWHTDRLVPWVHYIPISSDGNELPEVIRFLAQTDEGDRLARKIALNSRDWAEIALRRVDEQLVLLRILLELGRLLQDP